MTGLSLDIGGGDDPRGDLSVDVRLTSETDIRGDVRALPISDESVDEVYMIDVIEHIRFVELAGVLKELRRILEPGGRLWIRTPDFEWITSHYDDIPAERLERKLYGGYTYPLDYEESYPANSHQAIYTEPILRDRLANAGFENIQVSRTLGAPNHWNMGVTAVRAADAW